MHAAKMSDALSTWKRRQHVRTQRVNSTNSRTRLLIGARPSSGSRPATSLTGGHNSSNHTSAQHTHPRLEPPPPLASRQRSTPHIEFSMLRGEETDDLASFGSKTELPPGPRGRGMRQQRDANRGSERDPNSGRKPLGPAHSLRALPTAHDRRPWPLALGPDLHLGRTTIRIPPAGLGAPRSRR